MSIYFQKNFRIDFKIAPRTHSEMLSESAYFSSTAMVLALVAFLALEGEGKNNF